MDIRCERCATEYEIDDSRIPDAGLTIKCATCAHVFKVMRGVAPPPPPLALRLYRDGGEIAANCADFGMLQRWIVEQRVLATDDVSVSGQSWRRLGDVPELATFFALLSMPPPASMRTPTASPAYGIAAPRPPPPPPPRAPTGTLVDAAVPTVARPVLQWSPADSVPADDNQRTVQIQLTPDMFPPAPPPKTAPPHLPAPAPAPPSGLTGTAWPSLPTNLGEGLRLESMPPTPAPVFSPPAPAPTTHGPAAHVPTAPSTPKATPVVRPAPQPPKAAAARTTAAPKPPAAVKTKAIPRQPPETDPDLAAFVARRRNTRLAMIAVALVVLLGVGLYFGLPLLLAPKGPSAAAQAAYATGRQIYLLDTASQFPSAEDAFHEAINTEHGTYPQAEGALAELYAAWGEQLLAQYDALNARMKAMAAAGQDPKVLVPKVNEAGANAKDKLNQVFSQVAAAHGHQPDNLEAERALLDYYRLTKDAKDANKAADALKPHTDSETIAHLAAWEAMDPKQAAAAESALKGVVAQQPDFIRARLWLADLHLRQGNTTAADADMQAVLQLAPKNERANDYLDAQKTAAASAAAVAPDGGVTTAAATPPEATAQEAAAKEAAAKEAAAKEAHGKEPRSAREAAKNEAPHEASSGPVNVDKAIDEASRAFEHRKFGQALDLYERVLLVKPTLSDALYGRGLALYYLGRTDDAISAFKKTLAVNGRFGDAMIGVAEAYKKEGRKPEAVKYYQQYLDMYPAGAQAPAARANVAGLK